MTREEVAEVLQVSTRTVDRLRQMGELRATRIKTTVRFHPADVETYIASLRKWSRPNGGA
jgi:excisionase family DNA binding protein